MCLHNKPKGPYKGHTHSPERVNIVETSLHPYIRQHKAGTNVYTVQLVRTVGNCREIPLKQLMSIKSYRHIEP